MQVLEIEFVKREYQCNDGIFDLLNCFAISAEI